MIAAATSNGIIIASAMIAAVGGIIAALVSHVHGQVIGNKVDEVHVLVNQRLDAALAELEALKQDRRDQLTQRIEQAKEKGEGT